MAEEAHCCCVKTKHREEEEYKKLINRLNRIEGQVRGVKSMVDTGSRYSVRSERI